MKKNISILIGAILFLTYEIYILYRYIWFYLNRESYGNVFQDIMIVPHFIFMVIGTIFHFIYFFKQINWLRIVALICYVIGAIFLFI